MTDLGVVKVQEGGKVDVNIPSDDADLDTEYTKQLNILRVPPEKEVKPKKPEEIQEDYYKGIRSSVVLLWMFTNFGLAAVVLNSAGLDRLELGPDADERATIYLSVVLWSVAALSAFRFAGSCWFLIIRMVSCNDERFRHDNHQLTKYLLVPRSLNKQKYAIMHVFHSI